MTTFDVFSGGIFFHSSMATRLNSCGFMAAGQMILSFYCCHCFSMGLKNYLIAGHSTVTFFWPRVANLYIFFGSLSYWNTRLSRPKIESRYLEVFIQSSYTNSHFIFPLFATNFPVPLEEKHSQNITNPFACLTVGTMFFGKKVSPFLRHMFFTVLCLKKLVFSLVTS